MILISFCCICCAQLYILKGMHQNSKQGKILIFLVILFIILMDFNLWLKIWLFSKGLVARSHTRSGTHWACIDWFRYLGDSFVQNYAWSFQYGFWAISHHSNALFPPEVVALISSNLAMAFPSLIRNLISGSISEQLVGNYSKQFETHFINGLFYP